MDNSKTKMNLFEIPMQLNLHSECRNQCLQVEFLLMHSLTLSIRFRHNLFAISAVCLPVASSDSVVESLLSLTTRPGLTFRVLVLFPWEVAVFLWGLCINAVGAGLGRGRGNRPLRALTAAAPGYSPYNCNVSDISYFNHYNYLLHICSVGISYQ